MSNKSERVKQILVIIATAGVIFVNYLAGTGQINNTSTGYISDKYPTAITPAGYAFSIWSLIYLGLIAFSIYQALPKNAEKFANIRTVYILNCATNCAWLYLWHYEQITGSVAVMLLILATLVFINLNLLKSESTAELWLARIPFNIYFGWVTVATILNITIALVYLNVTVSPLLTTVLGCLLLVAATALGIMMQIRFANAAFPLTVAWAITAIAVKQSGQSTAIVTIAAFSVAALLISALSSFILTKKQLQ
jgi:translocator protein